MTQDEIKLRLIVFRGLVVLLFAFLAFETWRLQETRGEEFRLLADRNRFRVVTLDAPRGVIYDRNGKLLVRNRPTFNIEIIPAFLPEDNTARTRRHLSGTRTAGHHMVGCSVSQEKARCDVRDSIHVVG